MFHNYKLFFKLKISPIICLLFLQIYINLTASQIGKIRIFLYFKILFIFLF